MFFSVYFSAKLDKNALISQKANVELLDAQNEVQIKEAKQALAVRLRAEAISIKSKYIRVPKTTTPAR